MRKLEAKAAALWQEIQAAKDERRDVEGLVSDGLVADIDEYIETLYRKLGRIVEKLDRK